MEVRLDTAAAAVRALDAALEQWEAALPEVAVLAAYYESEAWQRDFADDAAGKLPQGLKRGVLSEDAVYDLLSDCARLREKLAELGAAEQ